MLYPIELRVLCPMKIKRSLRKVEAASCRLSGRLRCRNVFDGHNVQDSTTPGMRGKAFRIWIEPNLDGISQDPRRIMVLNVIRIAAGYFDSEWTKRVLFHSLLELLSREHLALFP